jgi:hypothetical protein
MREVALHRIFWQWNATNVFNFFEEGIAGRVITLGLGARPLAHGVTTLDTRYVVSHPNEEHRSSLDRGPSLISPIPVRAGRSRMARLWEVANTAFAR